MKLKAFTLALFAAGLLTGLTMIAPATGADPPTTTSGTTTSGTTTVATTTTTPHTTTTTTTTTPTTTTAAPSTTTTTPNYTNATDPISALSSTSITVGPLTCSIGSSSPGTGDFRVGVRVRIYCSNGALIYIKADTPAATTTTTATPTTTTMTTPTTTTTTSTNYTSATDAITALSSASITVGQLTCSIGSSSPHTGDFKVGDRARIYCASGVLAHLIRPDAPTTTTTATTTTTTAPTSDHQEHHDDVTTTRLGTISALNTASITVDGLTCTIGSSSPSLSAFRLGDQVGIGCTNGALVKIGTPQIDDGGFKVVVQLGSIVALGTGSITVGSLTCSLATSSPNVASYKVGDRVGVGCAGGILFMIGTLPSTDSVSKTDIRHALVDRFRGCIKHGSERCTVNGILHRLAHK
jgi:hypothetical protein